MKRIMKYNGFLHGGDYNPEQWLHCPEILEADIRLLKEANCNAVSVGIFSWASLEPEEGVFCFEWLEQVINNLHENGIHVILATPSGSKPKWMTDKYSEILRVDETRRRNLYGHRHNHCYTSPVYREKVGIMNAEMARRFANHPAVILWHLSNEYGGECHCELCQEQFRLWLKNKYETIENLNRRWCTTFWSHNYQSFEQIESPSPIGEMSLHALTLDWKRFITYQTIDFMKHEIAGIRPFCEQLPATTNMMYYYSGLNYYKFKDELDIISWDTYPNWHKIPESESATDNGMFHDIMRTIKKQPYLLMESCPTATSWKKVSKLLKPGMNELASLQAVAHGSDAVMYFQVRQSQGSFEKLHGAVIDQYGGNDTRVFGEVKDTGAALEKIKAVCNTCIKADVAVVYDWENRWALEDAQGPRNDNIFYKETVQKSYGAFRRMGFDVDVIDMEFDLQPYKIVAAPLLYMFREGFEERAKTFVEQGGILIVTYWSGVVDENDRCFLGSAPYGLTEVLGLRREEIDGLYDWESNTLTPVAENAFGMDKTYECRNLCELVKVSTAEPIMVYGEDFYKGKAVFTKNQFGKGQAYYIGADAEKQFYVDAYSCIVKHCNMELPLGELLPEGIEVTQRCAEERSYVFVQNFNKESVKLPAAFSGSKIIYGENADSVPGFGTVVIEKA